MFLFPVWSQLTDQLIHVCCFKTDPVCIGSRCRLLGTLSFCRSLWNSFFLFFLSDITQRGRDWDYSMKDATSQVPLGQATTFRSRGEQEDKQASFQ